MTRFVAKELATDHWFNITAARRDLGYTPRITMAAGTAELIEHLKSKAAARADSSVPLPHRFEQRDDRRHRDVERIGLAGHRDAHEEIAFLQPEFAQPVLLAAHDDRQRAAQIDLGVDVRRAGVVATMRIPFSRSQACTAALSATTIGTENSTPVEARTTFGIENIGHRIADDHAIDTRRIGAAQDRAEVAGFLDRLDHEQERGRGST